MRLAKNDLHPALPHLEQCPGLTKESIFLQGCFQEPPPGICRSYTSTAGTGFLSDTRFWKGWETQRLYRLVAKQDNSFWNLLHFISSIEHVLPLFLHTPPLPKLVSPMNVYCHMWTPRRMHAMCFRLIYT